MQYRVARPGRLPLPRRGRSTRRSRRVAEGALTRALAGRGIDELLTTGRAEVAERLGRVDPGAGRRARGWASRSVAVRLGRVAPPRAVAPAFADAARRGATAARRSRGPRSTATAPGRRPRPGPRDRRQRRRPVRPPGPAGPGRGRPVHRGAGRGRKALAATRRRLYLETLAELLPRFRRKVVVAPGQDLDISLFTEGARSPAGAGTIRRRRSRTRDARTGTMEPRMKRPTSPRSLTVLIVAVLLWSGLTRPLRTRRGPRPGIARAATGRPARPGRGAARALLERWRGDVAGYLGASAVRSATRLEREVDERGREAFADDLRRAARRARATPSSPPSPRARPRRRGSPSRPSYPDRNERQTYRLARDGGRRWLVTDVETVRRPRAHGPVRHARPPTRSPRASPSRVSPLRVETVRAEDVTGRRTR